MSLKLRTRTKLLEICRGASFNLRRVTPYNYLSKDEKGELLADSHTASKRWDKHIRYLLNVHGVNDVRLSEIHAAESLLPETLSFALQMDIEEVEKMYTTRYRSNSSTAT